MALNDHNLGNKATAFISLKLEREIDGLSYCAKTFFPSYDVQIGRKSGIEGRPRDSEPIHDEDEA